MSNRPCLVALLLATLALLIFSDSASAQTPSSFLPIVTSGKAIATPTPPWVPGTKNVQGHAQKGPYVQGTEIIVRELGEDLVPTGRSFPASIQNDDGSFTVRGSLDYPIVELSANGYYFNEVSGELSDGQLALRGLADLQGSTTINVNLLTHLEYDRVLFLVDGGMGFADAKTQAQQEILAALSISASSVGSSELLDISQSGTGNGALLAISAILQSNRSVAQLTELLSRISNDLREDGTIDNSANQSALLQGMSYIKPRLAEIRTNITTRYQELGVNASIPAFEGFAVDLDDVAPAVSSSTPSQGETTYIDNFTITFNDIINPATISLANIQLFNAANQSIAGTLTFVHTDAGTSVTFTPSTQLIEGEYRLAISTGVEDIAGNRLAVVTQIVASHELLIAQVSTEPAAGTTSPVAQITVHFDRAMDQSTLNSSTIRLLNASGNAVAGSVDTSDMVATFTPANPLVPGNYRLVIGSGIRDSAGRNFEGIGEIEFTHVYRTLNIVEIHPGNGTSVTSPLVDVVFDGTVDMSTINANTFRMANAANTTVPGQLSKNGNAFTFRPHGWVAPGVYRIVFGAGILDTGSVPFEPPVPITFTLLPNDLTFTYTLILQDLEMLEGVVLTFPSCVLASTVNTATVQLYNASNTKLTGVITKTGGQSGGACSDDLKATFRLGMPVGVGTYRLKVKDVQMDSGEGYNQEVVIEVLPPAEQVLIPAGDFQMGCSPEDAFCSADESPLHTVTLSAYYIDKYEVTNAHYKQCVDAGDCTALQETQSYRCEANGTNCELSEYYGVAAYSNFPVVVTWHEADAYCHLLGGRLPTEAEWERAARGDSDERVWPWGNTLACSNANVYKDQAGNTCDVGHLTAVGAYPSGSSPYGVMDMAGNAWEWVNDWSYRVYTDGPVTNPHGPESGPNRVLRGGSVGNNNWSSRVSDRSGSYPVNWTSFIGFRCVHSP